MILDLDREVACNQKAENANPRIGKGELQLCKRWKYYITAKQVRKLSRSGSSHLHRSFHV